MAAISQSNDTSDPALSKQLVVGNDANNQRVLKGDEKAAALLLALGPDYGRPIFDELDELEVKQLSRAMVRLGPITQEMLEAARRSHLGAELQVLGIFQAE